MWMSCSPLIACVQVNISINRLVTFELQYRMWKWRFISFNLLKKKTSVLVIKHLYCVLLGIIWLCFISLLCHTRYIWVLPSAAGLFSCSLSGYWAKIWKGIFTECPYSLTLFKLCVYIRFSMANRYNHDEIHEMTIFIQNNLHES